jgi:type III secretory pathway component EscU
MPIRAPISKGIVLVSEIASNYLVIWHTSILTFLSQDDRILSGSETNRPLRAFVNIGGEIMNLFFTVFYFLLAEVVFAVVVPEVLAATVKNKK